MGGALLQREDPRISIEVVTCRKKVAVDGPCSLLLRCCSVVAETVADGFRCLAYVYLGTFRTDNSIDKVCTGTRKVVSEVVGLFSDQGGDGMIGKEFRTCSAKGTVTWFNTITFRTYLQRDLRGGGRGFSKRLSRDQVVAKGFLLPVAELRFGK